METESEPTSVPSVDDLVQKLKAQNPNPREYVPGLYLKKARLLEQYEKQIQQEAIRLHSELEKHELDKSKQERRRTSLEAAEKRRLHDVAQRVLQAGPQVDYIGLSKEERTLYGLLSKQIEQKPLDDWTDDEKCIYRFWHGLRRFDLPKQGETVDQITPTEIRTMFSNLQQQQYEQIQSLRGIKGGISGLIALFVILLVLIPSLRSCISAN